MAMTRRWFALCACGLATPGLAQKLPPNPHPAPVQSAQAAIKIAVAAWKPIYGEANIARQQPYRATLKDGEWHVGGSLPPDVLGGTAYAVIAQKDGQVLRIFHTK